MQMVKLKIAFLEGISILNVSVLGEDYWTYGNAVITDIRDYGATVPELVAVAVSECVPRWFPSALSPLHVSDPSSGTLGWKTNLFYGWSYDLTESDFQCVREFRQISPSSAQIVSY
jgi:hypothetical protein